MFKYSFGHLYFNQQRNRQRSETFHRDICHAIREQNAGVARDIMHDVLQYAEHTVLAEIKNKPVTGASVSEATTLSGTVRIG